MRRASVTWSLAGGAALHSEGGVEFRVWAPHTRSVAVRIEAPWQRMAAMRPLDDGWFETVIREAEAGQDYRYVLDDDRALPDPVSRWQPAGVHGPSRVVDPRAFEWSDDTWSGIRLDELILYELHVGTFTSEGTFEATIPKLTHLKELGVNAVELMPVAEFPGGRNWGYDGVYPYAPQSTYGGPVGLKTLVDACHRHGLAVVLDVVYNHLGPEGNYLGAYGPYFTDRYRTPWGSAINYDGPDSDPVRRYFIDNALYWLTEYHCDGLRLDAIHGIYDLGAKHVLEELGEAFHAQARALGRDAWIIAESDLNDVRILRPTDRGGLGLDAQWSDDFHHALSAALTGAQHGYFCDFGQIADLGKAIREGFVYDGRTSVHRRRRHGNSSAQQPGEQLVVFVQNHDQVANGWFGDRLASVVSFEEQKLAVALLLCAPNLPLLFMGQEYAETAPFLYFTSHGDPALADAVRHGRAEEIAALTASNKFVDPQAAGTFERSRLDWARVARSPHREMLALHRDLIAVRRSIAALVRCRRDRLRVDSDEERRWLVVERLDDDGSAALLLCNLGAARQQVPTCDVPGDLWRTLWTADPTYGGPRDEVAPRARLRPRSADDRLTEVPASSAVLYTRNGASRGPERSGPR
jgi:maltooligosyltrehalose trehalohydrolase